MRPNGQHIYVTTLGDDTFRVMNRNATTGAPTFSASYINGVILPVMGGPKG